MTYEYDPNPRQRKPRRKKHLSTGNIILITFIAAALCVLLVFAFFHFGLGLTYVKIDTEIGGYVKFFGYVDENNNPSKGDLYYSDGTTATVDQASNTVTFSNGNVYTGTLSPALRMEGAGGKLICANGDEYEGDFDGGLFSGKGIYRYANGDVYEGEFKEGKKDGQGKLTWRDGSYYVGTFSDNKKEGDGEYHWADGSYYVGSYKGDLKDGEGTFHYSNGDIYIGHFENDARTGTGTYTWASGDEYEGEFKNNVIDGKGTYRFASGRVYEGEFSNGAIAEQPKTEDPVSEETTAVGSGN